MNEKKTVAQQAAELTPAQKKSILKYELIEGGIVLLIMIPLIVYYLGAFFALNDARDAYYDTLDDFNEISTPEQDERDTEEYYDAMIVKDRAQVKFNNAIVIFFTCAVVIYALLITIYFTVIKKKMPYYSHKLSFYLLTHLKMFK